MKFTNQVYSKDGQWRLLANNGNILTKGGKFKTLSGCKQGISIVEKIFGKIPKKIVLD